MATGFDNMEVIGDLDNSSLYGGEGIEAKFEWVGVGKWRQQLSLKLKESREIS